MAINQADIVEKSIYGPVIIHGPGARLHSASQHRRVRSICASMEAQLQPCT